MKLESHPHLALIDCGCGLITVALALMADSDCQEQVRESKTRMAAIMDRVQGNRSGDQCPDRTQVLAILRGVTDEVLSIVGGT